MKKRYVGYSEFYHDAGLAIIQDDGTVEFASQSERYTGIKNDGNIPDEMWHFVTKDDHVTFYEDYELRRTKMGGLRTFGVWQWGKQNQDKTYEELEIGEAKAPMYGQLSFDDFNLHHESHCALAFFTRPWESKEDTVMVSVDGSGELEAISIKDHNFNTLHTIQWPQSLGTIYGGVTASLGYKALRDEYIIMGLASYGEVDDELYKLLHNCYYWFESKQGKDVRMNVEFAGYCLAESELSAKYAKYETRFRHYISEHCTPENASATVQKFFEVEVMKIMTTARQYGSKLVYGGGCAQNVTANTLIRELFDEMHIAIAPSDSGNALGCAAYSWHKATGGTHLKWSPYLGHNIDRDIDPKEVAQYLVDNKICGVANGRAEYGPRALGNRSLLADVRSDINDTVNTIKRRQKFRPFAPAILSEHADEYFSGPMNEYMQFTAVAKHKYSSVTHADGTARVQLVTPDCKSVLRQILEEYYKLTGVPMLLNTSLNIRNKPMVNTVEEAIEWENKYKVKVF
tara:strand:- start:1663 stop:3204 length:1542 start_codon:yes stop_codon:yes gene_type:complete